MMSKVKRIIEVFLHEKCPKKEKIQFYKWFNTAYDVNEKEEVLNDYWGKIEVKANATTEDA